MLQHGLEGVPECIFRFYVDRMNFKHALWSFFLCRTFEEMQQTDGRRARRRDKDQRETEETNVEQGEKKSNVIKSNYLIKQNRKSIIQLNAIEARRSGRK